MNERRLHIGTATVRRRTTNAFFVEYSRRRTVVMSVLNAGFAIVGLVMLVPVRLLPGELDVR